ncbi:MAG: hypothetical protein WA913_07890 [Pricia sp.]
MPQDKFASTDSLTAPAREGFALIPDDTAAVADLPKAIYVGTGGDLVLRMADSDADLTLRNVADGALLPLRPAFVRATGTTAADIVGLL